MNWIIYKHTNKLNGKVYVGQTMKADPNYRWNNGKGYTKRNPDSHFARAILKYGWDNFDHEILESGIPSLEMANIRETYWIKFFNSVNDGYNSNYGGDSREPSQETKKKLSLSSKKMWELKGEELREIYQSEEHRKKLSCSIKKYYEKNPQIKETISKRRQEMIWITNGIEVRQINKKYFPNFKGQGNWQRGKVFIPFDLLALIIKDYIGENDLTLGDLSIKYSYTRGVILAALKGCGVKIRDKSYRTKDKTKGIKRSEETKQKLSISTSKARKNHIWVNDGIKSISILPAELDFYIVLGWHRGRGKINSKNMSKPQEMKKRIIRSDGKIYNSISEATKDMRLSKNAIRNVLTNKPHSKTAGGYGWKYLDKLEQ